MCILFAPAFVVFVALSPPIGASIKGSLQIAVVSVSYICGKHLVPDCQPITSSLSRPGYLSRYSRVSFVIAIEQTNHSTTTRREEERKERSGCKKQKYYDRNKKERSNLSLCNQNKESNRLPAAPGSAPAIGNQTWNYMRAICCRVFSMVIIKSGLAR